MATFVQDYGLGGFAHVADTTGELWAVFGVAAQPSYVFINDDGTVRRHVGGMESDDLVEQIELLIES